MRESELRAQRVCFLEPARGREPRLSLDRTLGVRGVPGAPFGGSTTRTVSRHPSTTYAPATDRDDRRLIASGFSGEAS